MTLHYDIGVNAGTGTLPGCQAQATLPGMGFSGETTSAFWAL